MRSPSALLHFWAAACSMLLSAGSRQLARPLLAPRSSLPRQGPVDEIQLKGDKLMLLLDL